MRLRCHYLSFLNALIRLLLAISPPDTAGLAGSTSSRSDDSGTAFAPNYYYLGCYNILLCLCYDITNKNLFGF